MIHFDDGGEALGGSEPEDGNADGLGERVAVHGDDGESVAGKGEAANLGGAGVEDVEEDALAGFHADGIAVAEHASVDGEGIVADFESVRQAAGEGDFHFALAGIFEFGDGLRGREKVLRHVAAAAEGGLKFFESEEDFAVVVAGMVLGLDVDRADEASVLAEIEIRLRRGRGCDKNGIRRAWE